MCMAPTPPRFPNVHSSTPHDRDQLCDFHFFPTRLGKTIKTIKQPGKTKQKAGLIRQDQHHQPAVCIQPKSWTKIINKLVAFPVSKLVLSSLKLGQFCCFAAPQVAAVTVPLFGCAGILEKGKGCDSNIYLGLRREYQRRFIFLTIKCRFCTQKSSHMSEKPVINHSLLYLVLYDNCITITIIVTITIIQPIISITSW